MIILTPRSLLKLKILMKYPTLNGESPLNLYFKYSCDYD